jgi:Family of unknown function (DUF6256)
MAVLPSGLGLFAQPQAGADPLDWADVLRHDVIPVLSAYLVFLAILLAYRHARRRAGGALHAAGTRSAGGERPTWRDLVRYLAAMVAGGYVFFLAIVVVFYLILGSEPRSFVSQALGEGSLLAVATIPAFLAISWAADRLARARSIPPEDRTRAPGG